jgi:hypothetical protein
MAEFMSDENFKSISERVNRFLSLCFSILTENNIKVNHKNIINIVNDMNIKQQKDIFISIYNDHKEDILKGYKSTEWIIGSDVVMFIDDDYELDLNKVYNSSCKISSINIKLMQKYKNVSKEKKYEAFYPKIFLYLLYSCFECFCPKEDRERVREITVEVKNFINNFGVVNENKGGNMSGFGEGFGQVLGNVLNIFTSNPKLNSMVKKSKIPIDSLIKDVSGALKDTDENTDFSSIINVIINKIPLSEEMFRDDESNDTDSKEEEQSIVVQQIEVVEDAPEIFELSN